MLGILPNQEIESLLHQEFIGRIGCHAQGITYIVPVSYAYDGQHIYVHTTAGKKIDMMRHNPDVCFQVDDMKDMQNWKSVIAWGRFEELTDTTKRDHALKILLDRKLPLVTSAKTRLGKYWPFPPSDLSTIEGITFKIHLLEKTGRFERSEPTSSYAS